ncbi:MAG: hypothetical protein JXO22_07790 [Phycisphaerae bacterium]|nr:hypothetical protein [Phycisphaerae bacterium]
MADMDTSQPLPSPESPAKAAERPPERPIVDVWSRTESKYRVRAIVLLAVNFVLFCGLCVFTHWLHVARPIDFDFESYAAPFRFWGEQTHDLNDFLLYPINVVQTPIHGIVLGLLVASIVAVPIAVSILYRFCAMLPFALAVLVFAHMPWMAVTLVGGAILASVRPFRLSFRFGSALLGLLPVLLYLYLATRVYADQVETSVTPEQRPLLFAPWVIAILAASVMLGTIMLLASVVRFRPGVVAPVLAAMLALPTVLFHTQVGTDELSYRVLETEFGPQSPRFKAVEDASPTIRQLVEENKLQPDILWLVIKGDLEPLRGRLIRHFLIELLDSRSAARSASDRFIVDHPNSRYVPNVLYLQARALDTRLDQQALLTVPSPMRKYYADFPHPQSERPWSVILREYGDSPLVAAAALRLAQLSLRSGNVGAAVEQLRPAIERDVRTQPITTTTQPGAVRGPFRSAPPEASLAFDTRWYLDEAKRLFELVRENRDDPKYGNAPLAALYSLDQRRAGHRVHLATLAERYADSLLADNLVLAWALAEPEFERRATNLEGFLARYTSGDAVPEALYRLASLEIQSLRDESGTPRERGLARMRTLADKYPNTIWGRLATEQLSLLEPIGPAVPAEKP